jgi:hypothetical protein
MAVAQRCLFAALASLALCCVLPGTPAQADPAMWLTVDLPYGGCRLIVRRDGTATIYFGAMPRWVTVARGTFNFEQLEKILRAKSYPQSDKDPIPLPGTLSFPDSTTLVIDDYRLVRSLLERAWKARELPKNPFEVEDYAWVSKACSLL